MASWSAQRYAQGGRPWVVSLRRASEAPWVVVQSPRLVCADKLAHAVESHVVLKFLFWVEAEEVATATHRPARHSHHRAQGALDF